jgi:hypothetical protein
MDAIYNIIIERENYCYDIEFFIEYTGQPISPIIMLPFYTLYNLSKIRLNFHRYLYITDFTEQSVIDTNDFYISSKYKFVDAVNSVLKTQTIKEELFSKTIPNYKPQTYRQRMAEWLGFDINHISIRGLQCIERYIPRNKNMLYEIYEKSIADFDEFHFFYLEISQSQLLIITIHQTSLFKEELIAKVFHPDRVEKWIYLV